MKKLVKSVENRRPVPLNVGDFAVPFYLSPNQKAELFVSEISESKADEVVVSEKPESNWFELGEFPPVGQYVEINNSGFWEKVFIVGFDSEGVLIVEDPEEGIFQIREVREFRPLDADRRQAIKSCAELLCEEYSRMDKNQPYFYQYAEALYAAGWRPKAEKIQ